LEGKHATAVIQSPPYGASRLQVVSQKRVDAAQHIAIGGALRDAISADEADPEAARYGDHDETEQRQSN
jgi:hypothetical protein